MRQAIGLKEAMKGLRMLLLGSLFILHPAVGSAQIACPESTPSPFPSPTGCESIVAFEGVPLVGGQLGAGLYLSATYNIYQLAKDTLPLNKDCPQIPSPLELKAITSVSAKDAAAFRSKYGAPVSFVALPSHGESPIRRFMVLTSTGTFVAISQNVIQAVDVNFSADMRAQEKEKVVQISSPTFAVVRKGIAEPLEFIALTSSGRIFAGNFPCSSPVLAQAVCPTITERIPPPTSATLRRVGFGEGNMNGSVFYDRKLFCGVDKATKRLKLLAVDGPLNGPMGVPFYNWYEIGELPGSICPQDLTASFRAIASGATSPYVTLATTSQTAIVGYNWNESTTTSRRLTPITLAAGCAKP